MMEIVETKIIKSTIQSDSGTARTDTADLNVQCYYATSDPIYTYLQIAWGEALYAKTYVYQKSKCRHKIAWGEALYATYLWRINPFQIKDFSIRFGNDSRRISDSDVLRINTVLQKNIMNDAEDDPALTALITSARSGYADAVEHAVRDVYAVGLKSSHVQPLIDLLKLDWHTRHEDIVGLLQRAKDDRASNVLLETATRKFDYLDYDENEGLARKCTWALADIGSPTSTDHLRTLAKNENELIANYAKKRLSA